MICNHGMQLDIFKYKSTKSTFSQYVHSEGKRTQGEDWLIVLIFDYSIPNSKFLINSLEHSQTERYRTRVEIVNIVVKQKICLFFDLCRSNLLEEITIVKFSVFIVLHLVKHVQFKFGHIFTFKVRSAKVDHI